MLRDLWASARAAQDWRLARQHSLHTHSHTVYLLCTMYPNVYIMADRKVKLLKHWFVSISCITSIQIAMATTNHNDKWIINTMHDKHRQKHLEHVGVWWYKSCWWISVNFVNENGDKYSLTYIDYNCNNNINVDNKNHSEISAHYAPMNKDKMKYLAQVGRITQVRSQYESTFLTVRIAQNLLWIQSALAISLICSINILLNLRKQSLFTVNISF